MAHGLMEYDWMISAKERPWHGIGTVVDDAPTSEDAIKMAKLDWAVKQVPIKAGKIEIPGYFANIRSDVNYPLGVVKNRYRIVQNAEAFDFVDDIIGNEKVECRYETAGSIFNGKKIFLLVKLPNTDVLGDEVENYMFFTNSHDGSSAFMAGITNVRVVCNNTLQMAIRGAKRTWYCRHTQSIESKKLQAKESLGLAVNYMDSMPKFAIEMAEKKVREEVFFRRLFENNNYSLGEKNIEKAIERMHIIYNEKDDLQNFKGTAWGMYNAVADYCSNTTPYRNTATYADNKLNKSLIGFPMLEEAQKILMVA